MNNKEIGVWLPTIRKRPTAEPVNRSFLMKVEMN